MRKLFTRILGRRRGMEALQSVLLLGAAFFIIIALKSLGSKFAGTAGTGGNSALTNMSANP